MKKVLVLLLLLGFVTLSYGQGSCHKRLNRTKAKAKASTTSTTAAPATVKAQKSIDFTVIEFESQKLVKTGTLDEQSGTNAATAGLPAGMYVIIIGNKRTKVAVKP
jgi:hypothetical protein